MDHVPAALVRNTDSTWMQIRKGRSELQQGLGMAPETSQRVDVPEDRPDTCLARGRWPSGHDVRSERGKHLSVQRAIEPDGNVDGTMRHGTAVHSRKKKETHRASRNSMLLTAEESEQRQQP